MKKGTLSTAKAEKYRGDMPMREKYWKELNQKEKIERTREVIKKLQNQLQELQRDMERVNRHTHNEEGEAVVVEKIRGGYDQAVVRIREGEVFSNSLWVSV